VTSLTDFAAQTYESTGALTAKVTSLLLAGEHDQAAEFVRRIAGDPPPQGSKVHPVRAHWERASRDIEALCAECHALEAEAIKAMKLESIWEPSPFPVELPSAQRSRSAEPAFSTIPWISEPPDLFAEVPQPGQVRFAKGLWRRDDALVLLVPLTREAAEDRHNHLEDYVLAARLANGLLFTLTRGTGWDRNKPQEQSYVPDPRFVDLSIRLYGSSHVAAFKASPDEREPGLMGIWSIDVHEQPSYSSIWDCYIGRRDGEWTVHDSRGSLPKYAKSDVTDTIRALASGPIPKFGEYADLVARAQALLRQLGYGEVR